ncbi:MAG: hypothetical protein RMK94_17550 [Armatimonadota bacterium]|nr:hypothetical protein [Armatimonadota bacterium]
MDWQDCEEKEPQTAFYRHRVDTASKFPFLVLIFIISLFVGLFVFIDRTYAFGIVL